MDKSTTALIEVAASLGIHVSYHDKNVNTEFLKLEILAGIDSLVNRVQCVEKDAIKARRKKTYWRSIAKGCVTREA